MLSKISIRFNKEEDIQCQMFSLLSFESSRLETVGNLTSCLHFTSSGAAVMWML